MVYITQYFYLNYIIIANYLIKNSIGESSKEKNFHFSFYLWTSSIKAAKQYIYLSIDSNLETRNSKTFRYLSFFLFPRRKTRRLKFRLRVVVWTISRPLKRLTYDFVGCTHDPGTRPFQIFLDTVRPCLHFG